ncbi:MAG: hypothetical protein JOZ55_07790 [Alphaproteobacteria bacterium]|nr:hypothetical protein [Alphaproteobacteria bacterium]
MTLSDLASIGSLVSGIAVLVSLVYLARQMQQNTRHTRALIQQGRSIQAADLTNRWAEDPSLIALLQRGTMGDTSLSEEEVLRFVLMQFSAYQMWEDRFYQHKAGLIDEERHAGTVREIRERLQRIGYRAAWQMQRNTYGKEYQAFVDGLIAEVRAAPGGERPFSETWKLLLAEEARATKAG